MKYAHGLDEHYRLLDNIQANPATMVYNKRRSAANIYRGEVLAVSYTVR